MARIEIWSPKYSNDTVRIDVNKVAIHNVIYFTKANHLIGKEFYITGEKVRQYPIKPNGRGKVYEVPMKELQEV